MKFVFPCIIEKDGNSQVVIFPDIPEAMTQLDPGEDFYGVVHDCLITALRGRVEDREALPVPSAIRGRTVMGTDALEAAKLALYSVMRKQGISNVALAARLGVTEAIVRRLLDLDHRSHIGQVEKALKALGQRLEISVKIKDQTIKEVRLN